MRMNAQRLSLMIFGAVTLWLATVVLPVTVTAVDDAPEPAVEETAGAEAERQTLLGLLLKGGLVMIPIALCSIIALTVALERSLSLKRRRIMSPEFIDSLKSALGGGHDGARVRSGLVRCDENPSPISRIYRAGILRLHKGEAAVEKAVTEAGAREVSKLKRSLRPLSVIATLAPLFGLLGTVYGMIVAFEAAAAAGVDRADTLARGIYEALVTTAAGLTLAIPVLIVYQILNARVDMLVDDIDEQATLFFEDILEQAGNIPAPSADAVPAPEIAGTAPVIQPEGAQT